jgi:hypothetical protein
MKTLYEAEDLKQILEELLAKLKNELVKDVESKILRKTGILDYKLLRNKDLKKILSVSDSTIENIRNSQSLPYTKILGTYYYHPEDVNAMLEKNKLNFKTKDHE